MADETWTKGDVIKIDADEYEANKVYVTLATDEYPGIFMFSTRRWFAEMYRADHAKALQVDALVKALEKIEELPSWPEKWDNERGLVVQYDAEAQPYTIAREALESFRQAGGAPHGNT